MDQLNLRSRMLVARNEAFMPFIFPISAEVMDMVIIEAGDMVVVATVDVVIHLPLTHSMELISLTPTIPLWHKNGIC